MTEVFLSLGSNIGNRTEFIERAARLLGGRIKITGRSNLYETAPWGNTDQPKFLNLCLKGETELSAPELLVFIKNVEAACGRSPGKKWGPREIDIDILFYGRAHIELKGLKIPHPHMHERAFVLVPLEEIANDFIHPVLKKSISELADSVDKSGIALYEA
ncbi:2-amino-4-hydroxy-6-hydroxymethyldihydropteridine diphosphokinase [Candidatus Parcubacteria bacterium]|nr:2-amino-4-hydroxy-6-hydroxymethyldihydropteridine diphosphokinase [Candidatus Parcubacteria bacterium]